MKAFFDESGQTGCVLQNKNGDLYNDNQRFFVLAGVICCDRETEDLLRKRYQDFLNHFGISADEFKGTDILTKANNDKLEYFVENLIDEENFYIFCSVMLSFRLKKRYGKGYFKFYFRFC